MAFATLLPAPVNLTFTGPGNNTKINVPFSAESRMPFSVGIKCAGQLTIKVLWYADAARTVKIAEDTAFDGPAVGGAIAFNTLTTRSPYAVLDITNKDVAAPITVDQIALFY